MKKALGLLLICLFAYMNAQAYTREDIVERRVQRAVGQAVQAERFLSAVKNGQTAEIRILLATKHSQQMFLATDGYGNNVLHAASNPKIFALLWKAIPENTREQLLNQANHIGEIPLMTQIAYGQEDIFLTYFPQTQLYERLKRTSSDLAAGGVLGEAAQIKRSALIKQCSAAGQTMWQRANYLYQTAANDIHQQKMKQIQNQIAQAAPFLIR